MMAGTERPRDWDKELAEVDKLLSKLPNADPTLGRAVPAGRAAAPAAPGVSGGSALGTWLRVGLAGMVIPRPHSPVIVGIRLQRDVARLAHVIQVGDLALSR